MSVGNPERGWNDPPVFLHTPSSMPAVSPATKRTLLNKRVAAPELNAPKDTLEKASATPPLMTSTSSANVVLLPPTAAPISSSPNNPVPLIIPHMAPGRDAQAPSSVVLQAAQGMPTTHVNQTPAHPGDRDLALPHFNDDEQLYHFVTSRLRKTLTDCSKQFTKRIESEVARKLEIFDTMWRSGKLSYQVKCTMAKLATALHKRHCDVAHELHMSLMMDFVSEVSPWMVAIKRLIQESRTVSPPCSPTLSADESPSITASTSPVISPVITVPTSLPSEHANEQDNITTSYQNSESHAHSTDDTEASDNQLNDTSDSVKNSVDIASLVIDNSTPLNSTANSEPFTGSNLLVDNTDNTNTTDKDVQ